MRNQIRPYSFSFFHGMLKSWFDIHYLATGINRFDYIANSESIHEYFIQYFTLESLQCKKLLHLVSLLPI